MTTLLTDEEFKEILARWPNCATPDCHHKTCVWSPRRDLCYPCSVRVLGVDAMTAAEVEREKRKR